MAKKRNGNPNDPGTFFVNTGRGTLPVVMDSQMHRDLYNSGRLMTYDPQRDEYVAPNLPEFAVTAKRNKSFLEEWGDKIVQESQGSGPAGAIFGATMNAGSSLAQLALTKLLTGKTQRPSEAMNIQNPYGGMAVDAVLDPLNALGGFAAKGNKLLGMFGRKAAINPAMLTDEVVDAARTKWWNNMPLSEVEQAAIELQGKGSKNSYKYSLLADKGISGDLTGKSDMYKSALNNLEKSLASKGVSGMRDVIYDSSELVSPSKEGELLRHAFTDFQNPELFNNLMSLKEEAIKNFNPRRVPENSEIVKLANDYWGSPEVKNKLINQFTRDDYNFMVRVLRDLSLSDKKAIARGARQDFTKKYDDILNNLKDVEIFQTKNNSFFGQYHPTLHTAYISDSVPLSNRTLRLSTGIHEVGSHGALRGSRNMPGKMSSEITSSFLPKDVLSKIANSTDDPLRFTARWELKDPYFTTDYETHARLLETRLHSGNFPQGQLNWNHFQKAVDAGVLDDNFTKLIINKDKFVRDANKYSSMLPIIPSLNNSKTESYQKGGPMLKDQFNLFQKQKLSKKI